MQPIYLLKALKWELFCKCCLIVQYLRDKHQILEYNELMKSDKEKQLQSEKNNDEVDNVFSVV